MKTPSCTIWNQDCIAGMAERLGPGSIDLCVTSIPFEDLFQYSNRPEDLGNNGNTIDIREGRFALNLRFFIEQLLRVMKPGCNACIHIQQLLAFKNQHGFMGRRDFRGAVIDLFRAGGFDFAGEFVVAKDPQVVAIQLNLHSLQFKTGYARSATRLMPAPNDYVLIFQKPGEPEVPVRCLKHERNPGGWYSMDEWIRDACGTWTDIRPTDVLDVESGREGKHEKHVCPLQLSLIARLVRLYTNPVDVQPGVTVLDPFMGIGSTAWACLRGDCRDGRIEGARNVVGFELKESYHRAATDFAARALAALAPARASAPRSLFDDPEPDPLEAPEDPSPMDWVASPGSLPVVPGRGFEAIDRDGLTPTIALAPPPKKKRPRKAPAAVNRCVACGREWAASEGVGCPACIHGKDETPGAEVPGAAPLPDGSRIVYRDNAGQDWPGVYRFTLGDLASITLDEIEPGHPVVRFIRVVPSALRPEPAKEVAR